MPHIVGLTERADALEPSPDGILRLFPLRLHADPSRVVIRPFHLGWQATTANTSRAEKLVADILDLDETTVESEYAGILNDFAVRHWQIEAVFEERCAEVASAIEVPDFISTARRRLIGAYFCHEYSYAAAALMNPSVVPHPDQSDMGEGEVRFIMSMRAVGEGHISSIAFREGIASIHTGIALWPQPPIATAAMLDAPEQPLAHHAVRIHRHADCTLSGTVIFPMTDAQRNGLEDLRLVRCTDEDGAHCWIGTYTAYNGREIRSELLMTEDFRNFTLQPISGRAGRNKGMALFPETIGGRHFMLGRQDGKNLYLLSSDRIDHWNDEGMLLLEPRFPWEFIQIGNCGSPILTRHGWLVLTHGVGAMRKYSIGALLLDRDDPSIVLGRSAIPLLAAKDQDRVGYVPNVVYTCGAIPVGNLLFMPYGISDSAIGFACVDIDELVATLV
ncbi:glycoside hydrolase family 130 protein [Novosphingobium sp.]|uniref:glycoside hydrolase family 130 protein n=1 Tax=Novosphingobium sp. TaxID=1874826 RepID=UPI0038BCFE17